MGKLPRRDAILNLCETLSQVPSNIASLVIRPDGSFEATFRQAGEAEPAGSSAPAVKRVPGSIFPDDDSPIDAADLVLNPIDLGEEN